MRLQPSLPLAGESIEAALLAARRGHSQLRTCWLNLTASRRNDKTLIDDGQRRHADELGQRLTLAEQRRTRGNAIYPEWRTFSVFKAWAELSGWAPGLRLTRRNPKVGWNPENCVWSDSRRTPRVDNIILAAFGESKPLVDWLTDARCVVAEPVLRRRIDRQWPAEKALSTPARPRKAVKRESA